MADQVSPGPCPSTGCPPPTEIDCIMVDKVYASCVQTVTATGTFTIVACTATPITCLVDLTDSSCTVGAISPSGIDDINNVTFIITAVLDITCSGLVTPVAETIVTTVTVPLYNPSGTTPICSILSASCTCVLITPSTVTCNVALCLLAQTTATVQLLIPTYGFCQPSPCEPGPTLNCPPVPLYPPQQQ
jgi:hypothetical protein